MDRKFPTIAPILAWNFLNILPKGAIAPFLLHDIT